MKNVTLQSMVKIGTVITLQCGTMAYAGAYQQLLDMTGGGSVYVPPPSNPECVSGCGGDDYESDGGERRSWIDVIQEQREEAQRQAERERQANEQKRKQEAFNLNEQGNRAYEKQQWTTAVELYTKAREKSPTDKVIQSNLEAAERELRREEERKAEQSEYRKKMGKISALLPKPKPQSIGEERVKSSVPLPGFSAEQWKEYAQMRDIVNTLYAQLNRDGKLSDEEAQKFYAALKRRNELWLHAVEQPMSDGEREKLRLALPTVIHKALLKLDAVMNQLDPSAKSTLPADRFPDRRSERPSSKPDAIMTVFESDFFADKGSEYLEYEVGETIEAVHGDAMKSKYENLLGVGHIAIAAKENGTAGALAGTADFIISKMPEPLSAHAGLATEGGRMYANVAYRALNRFMSDAMRATGAEFDAETFWKRFDDDLTLGQKGVKQWIEFGE
jgi:hypothetical protein